PSPTRTSRASIGTGSADSVPSGATAGGHSPAPQMEVERRPGPARSPAAVRGSRSRRSTTQDRPSGPTPVVTICMGWSGPGEGEVFEAELPTAFDQRLVGVDAVLGDELVPDPEGGGQLPAGEVEAEAPVGAEAEGDVPGLRPVEVDVGGVVEEGRTPVGRRDREHDHVAGAHRAAVEVDVPGDLAAGEDDGVHPQELLDGRRPDVGV